MPKIDLTRAEVLNGMSSLVFCLVRTPILAQITTEILKKTQLNSYRRVSTKVLVLPKYGVSKSRT